MRMTYKQVFYSLRSALEIEVSKNGVFFTIAENNGKNSENQITYNWEKKSVAKISSDELCNLLEGLQAFREDSALYEKLAIKLNGDDKYKNFQFVHKTEKAEIRTGWNVFKDKINYIIYNKNSNTTKSYRLQNINIARVEKFLDYIINISFHYDAIDTAESILNKKKG
jgi:hypothetical protein